MSSSPNTDPQISDTEPAASTSRPSDNNSQYSFTHAKNKTSAADDDDGEKKDDSAFLCNIWYEANCINLTIYSIRICIFSLDSAKDAVVSVSV